jgi:transposase InsO family protein
VVDAYTRECLAIAVRRRRTLREVQEVLSELFLHRGCPTHIRSDNGLECIARALRAWYGVLAVAPVCIEPGSPSENGFVESFNGTLRDAWLNGNSFIRCTKPKSSSGAGAVSTTRSARIVRWGIGRPPQRPAPSRRSACRRERNLNGGLTTRGRSGIWAAYFVDDKHHVQALDRCKDDIAARKAHSSWVHTALSFHC